MSAAADPFRHEALLYAGDDELVSAVSAFVRDGRAAGEPTLVLVGARKLDLLREELGDEADGAHFADIAAVGRNPARIIPAWQDFVTERQRPEGRIWGIGEPIWPGRSDADTSQGSALLRMRGHPWHTAIRGCRRARRGRTSSACSGVPASRAAPRRSPATPRWVCRRPSRSFSTRSRATS